MKGYLLKEQAFTVGEACLVESHASENNYAVVFEDDAETGYFYALETEPGSDAQRVLDAVHIYEVPDILPEHRPGTVALIWSRDWQKCALLINNYCHGIFDFSAHGGYCRNAFPPPNEIWTKGERILTDELVTRLFG